MAFLTCSFFSKILQKTVQFNAIIPPGKEKNAPVLYLLHGLSDDYSSWMRYTSIERYANEAGIVVIMPDGGQSFYSDMAFGNAYFSFFTEEFFDYIPSLFSVSPEREKTFIAGLSMGGYGALKIALRTPERFSAAGSLSGPLDFCWRYHHDPRWQNVRRLVIGDDKDPTGTPDDLLYLVQTYKKSHPLRLYITCGTEDFLYKDNLTFLDILSKSAIPYQTHFTSGIHDWNFWDSGIKDVISFFVNYSF